MDPSLCNYVLNELLPEEQAHVLMAIAELLKLSGKAYFTVRRDIQRNGFWIHTKLGVEVDLSNVFLPDRIVHRTEHCEIYEYQHFNQISKIVENTCPLCAPDIEREMVTESTTVYAMFDKYPATEGHTLIIPKQHVVRHSRKEQHHN